MTAAGRPAWWTGAAVFTAAGALALLHGDVGWDGTWVLQVVSRMQSGDVLYRDVFAGVTPLAFYIARAATAVLGLEFVVLKLLVAATVAVSWWAAARVLRRLTASARFDWPLAAAMVASALPENASFYQPLANMFLLLAVDGASRWAIDDDPAARRRSLVAAGAACALAFLSKQTVGLAAAAAIAAIVLVRNRLRPAAPRAAPAALAIVAAVFAAVVAAVLAPVVWSGGFPAFLDYAFLNKGTYLEVGGVPYLEELSAFVASTAPGGGGDIVKAAKSLGLLAPVLAAGAAMVLIARRRDALDRSAVVASLIVAELATLYPRADLPHVIPAVPGLLVGLFYAWHVARAAGRRWTSVAGGAAVLAVAGSLLVRGAAAVASIADDTRIVSATPHLRWLVVPRAHLDEIERAGARLREAGARGPLMLLVPNAGLYYMISGLRNPTPFDYPLVTAFGRTGLDDTAARIESGAIPQVCMKRVSGLLAPDRVQRVVATVLQPGDDLGVCTLYRRRD